MNACFRISHVLASVGLVWTDVAATCENEEDIHVGTEYC